MTDAKFGKRALCGMSLELFLAATYALTVNSFQIRKKQPVRFHSFFQYGVHSDSCSTDFSYEELPTVNFPGVRHIVQLEAPKYDPEYVSEIFSSPDS